ncbi:hypothetical protein [Companilactobacillus tucceti]|nr:hypothetical protein [Companilactobacillus tucceti]
MLMLVGCHHNKQQSVISKNKQRWNQETKKAEVKKSPSFGMMDYSNEPLTWHKFKKQNDSIILGTVIDYKKNKNQTMFPTTSVQVKVDKVLAGKKFSKYITTVFPSGFGYEDKIETNIEGNNADGISHKEYLYQKKSFPLPKIGSKFVTGIVKDQGKYQVSAPLFNFWTFNKGQLKLNNLDIRNIENDEKVDQLRDLTEFLNCKLNSSHNK